MNFYEAHMSFDGCFDAKGNEITPQPPARGIFIDNVEVDTKKGKPVTKEMLDKLTIRPDHFSKGPFFDSTELRFLTDDIIKTLSLHKVNFKGKEIDVILDKDSRLDLNNETFYSLSKDQGNFKVFDNDTIILLNTDLVTTYVSNVNYFKNVKAIIDIINLAIVTKLDREEFESSIFSSVNNSIIFNHRNNYYCSFESDSLFITFSRIHETKLCCLTSNNKQVVINSCELYDSSVDLYREYNDNKNVEKYTISFLKGNGIRIQSPFSINSDTKVSLNNLNLRIGKVEFDGEIKLDLTNRLNTGELTIGELNTSIVKFTSNTRGEDNSGYIITIDKSLNGIARFNYASFFIEEKDKDNLRDKVKDLYIRVIFNKYDTFTSKSTVGEQHYSLLGSLDNSIINQITNFINNRINLLKDIRTLYRIS